MFTNPNSRTLLTHTVLVFSSVIILGILGVILFLNNRSHMTDLQKGYETAQQLTTSLADDIELNFVAIDLTLSKAVDRQYLNSLFNNNLRDDMSLNLSLWLKETPNIDMLFLVNDQGVVEVLSSKLTNTDHFAEGSSIEEETFFKRHRDSSSIKPVILPSYNDSILMSRRIDKLDGSFGGVAVAVLAKSNILQLFTTVEASKKTHLMLLQKNNILLKAPPFTLFAKETLLPIVTASEIYSQPRGNIVTLEETLHKDLWIFSFKQLKNFPLLVSLGLHEDDIFTNSRANKHNYFIFFFIFSAFAIIISVFTLLMSRQIQHVQASEKAAILASQAKSDFLAKMSHELRTPLNAIIGFSQMMDSGYFGTINEKQRDRIHDINLCGTHLLELINDILEFSKGESGKLILADEPTDFSQLVQKVMKIVDQRAKVAEVTLKIDLPPDLPLLLADERKIRQTLINLISNAVKFTPRGGTVTLAAEIDISGRFVFSVTDTGIGIASEDIPRALSVFGQVHTHLNTEGTGLGLPLCKMFIELHGGELKLTSVINKGTTVTVIFPPYRAIYRT